MKERKQVRDKNCNWKKRRKKNGKSLMGKIKEKSKSERERVIDRYRTDGIEGKRGGMMEDLWQRLNRNRIGEKKTLWFGLRQNQAYSWKKAWERMREIKRMRKIATETKKNEKHPRNEIVNESLVL